jgi:hypothetical protein
MTKGLSRYHDFNFGFATKAKAWKGAGWECDLGVTFALLKVQENVREWAHTLSSELPFWELKFLWSPEFSKNNLKGKKSLDWGLLYTIEKILKRRCLRWDCMIHLSTYNTSYGWKKGWKSKCQFDYWPLKVGNYSKLCACRWRATHRWKAFNKGCNFASNLIQLEVFTRSYGRPKWWES